MCGYALNVYKGTRSVSSTSTNKVLTNVTTNALPLSIYTPGLQSAQIIYNFSGYIASINSSKTKSGTTLYAIQLNANGQLLPFTFDITDKIGIISGRDKSNKKIPLKITDLHKNDPVSVDYTADLTKSNNLYVIQIVKIL